MEDASEKNEVNKYDVNVTVKKRRKMKRCYGFKVAWLKQKPRPTRTDD